MKCNIDSRGKAARFLWGAALIVLAIVQAALTFFGVWPATAGWIAAAVLFAFGAFAIFEARAGWCIVRAMGFKTPV